MFTFADLDESTPFLQQLQETTGEIVLINTFLVPDGMVDQAIQSWHDDAAFMQAQAGFVSAQLHRGVGPSRLVTNTTVWESTEALRNALSSPEFAEKAQSYPEGMVVYPHICRRVAVEGVCGA
jgi:heme-degrading monooxygenase HmoA